MSILARRSLTLLTAVAVLVGLVTPSATAGAAAPPASRLAPVASLAGPVTPGQQTSGTATGQETSGAATASAATGTPATGTSATGTPATGTPAAAPPDGELLDVYTGLPGSDRAPLTVPGPADTGDRDGTEPASGVDPAVMAAADADGSVPVIVRLAEQADMARVSQQAVRAGRAAAAAVRKRPPDDYTIAEQDRVAREARRDARVTAVVDSLQAVADRTQGGVRELLAEHGADDLREFWVFNGFAATVDEATLQALADHPAVASVELDDTIVLDDPIPADPGEPLLPTGSLEAIHAPQVWGEYGTRGAGVVVGIMDTGVDASHPALADSWRGRDGDLAKSWIVTTGENYPEPGDGFGHGTHVTGTIVGAPPGGEVTGVAPDAEWIAAKVLNDFGRGPESAIHAGFEWMLAPGGDPDAAPDVVNNSWGSDLTNLDVFWDDVAAWDAAGIVPIFSNGNAGPGTGTVGSPASYPHSIGVGATDDQGRITYFSSKGPVVWDGVEYTKPDISAPGWQVRSSIPVELDADGDGYALASGTSMAAPHVTGVVALMRSAAPDLTVDQIRTALAATASGSSLAAALPNSYGAGVVDAYAAVTYVAHTGTVTGTVTGADGEPLAATVTVGDTTTTTDPQTGGYALRVFPGTHPLTVTAYGYATHRTEVAVSLGGTVTVDVTLATTPVRTLSGTVTGPDGPVPDARVAVADTPLVAVRTDPDGRFALAAAEGSYQLRVAAGDFAPATVPVTVDGDTDVAVELVPRAADPGWSQYQNNPSRTGRSGDGLAGEAVQPLWTVPTGGEPAFASPVIADGKVFLNLDEGQLAAFDLTDGRKLWTFTGSSGMRGTPAVADGVVYTGGGVDGGIHAVSAETGELIWRLETPGRRTIYTTPVVEDGVVYATTGFTTNGSDTVFALDAASGDVIWSVDIGERVFGGPAVGEGLVVAASAEEQTLYALDAATGAQVWTMELSGPDEFVGHPSIADGTVYVTTSVPPPPLAPGWQGSLLAVDAATGTVRWEVPNHGDGQGAAPAVYGDLVIAGSHGLGMVAAYDRDTGEPVWHYGLEVNGGVSNSVLVSGDGYVVAGAQLDDRVFILDANDGTLVLEQPVADGVLSAPAYADGHLVVADSSGALHAFHPTGQLRGVVTGPDGPVAATVRVVEADREVTAEPDTGEYLIAGLTPGSYTVEVIHYGLATETRTVQVLAAQVVTLDAELVAIGDGSLAGVVTDQDGQPLAGASVTLSPTPLAPVVTGEGGGYGFDEVAAGTYQLVVTKAGYQTFRDTVTVQEGQATVADATLERFDVAVVSDYQSQVTDLLTDAGYHVNRVPFAEISDTVGAYEVVVLAGMSGDRADADLDRFATIVADADAAGTSLVVLGSGHISYGSVRTMSEATGDPASTGHTSASRGTVWLQDVVPHPITASLPLEGQIPVLTETSLPAWFNGYSGHTLATLGTDRDGPLGGGIGYQRRTLTSNHILLPSSAPSTRTQWQPIMADLVLDAVGYAASAVYGQVSGVVTGPDGSPVAAQVEVVGDLARATAGADGSYSLLVPPGEHTLRVRLLGAQTVEVPVTVVAGQVHVRDVALPPATLGTLTGVVTDAGSGQPVAGATVSLPDTGLPPATTGADGRYVVENIPGGSYRVEVTADGYQPLAFDAVEVTEGAVTTRDASLTRSPAVVVVGDSDGQLTNFLRSHSIPAEEAGWEVLEELDEVEVVILNNPPDLDRDEFLAALEAFDDADVSVIFPASGFGFRTRGIELLVTHTGDPPEQDWIGSGDPDIFLQDLADHPLFDGIADDPVQILFSGADAAAFPTYSGITLANVSTGGPEPAGIGVAYQPRTAGSVHLLLTGLLAAFNNSPTTDWTDQGRQIFLNAVRWAADPQQSEVSGSVTDAAGEPVPDATVEVIGTSRRDVTDADGAFRVGVAPGEYTVRYSAFGYTPVERTVVLGPGQTVDAPVELPVGDVGAISGVVTSGGNGAALADVQVTLHGSPYRTVTAADGSYTFTRVEPGEYELELEADGHVRTLTPVTVAADQTTTRDVALRVSATVGIIGDSDFSSTRDRGAEFLTDWGYQVEDIDFGSLDRIGALDLVVVNVSEPDLELSFDQFKAFEDAVNRAGVPVLWMGQDSRGGIEVLQQHDGNPGVVDGGIGDGTVTATVVEDHPLVAGVPEQFELLEPESRYSWFDEYDGHVVATLATGDDGEVGATIAYRGRTAGTVDVLLSTMSITASAGPSTRQSESDNWTPEAERVYLNALAWALDAQGIAAEVRGTVTSDLGGNLASEVTVQETGRIYRGRSGDGTFLVPLPPGTWTLQVSSFGHSPATIGVTVQPGDVVTEQVILTALPSGTVTGTVTGPDGSPLAGARVTLVDTPRQATTGADGRFTLSQIPQGQWTLQVTAEGHLTERVPVAVTAGQATPASVSLPEAPTVAVVVPNTTQDPNEALLALLDGDGYDTVPVRRTDMGDVATTIEDYDLVILNTTLFSQSHRDDLQAVVAAAEAAAVPVVIGAHSGNWPLHELSELRGDPASVTNDHVSVGLDLVPTTPHPIFAGYPVGQRIELTTSTLSNQNQRFAVYEGYSGTTIADVHDRVDGVRLGPSIGYRFTTPTSVELVLANLTPAPIDGGWPGEGWSEDAERIYLNAIRWAIDATQAQLVGTVTGNGQPLAGATVTAVEAGATTVTAADGSYALGLGPGSHTVRVSAPGFQTAERTVQVPESGTVTLDVDLAPLPRGAVAGTVTSTTGDPVSGATVTGTGPLGWQVVTGDDGGYTAGDLLEGTYQVTVTAHGYLPATAEVTVTADQVAELDVTLEPVVVGVLGDEAGTLTAYLREAGIPAGALAWRTGLDLGGYQAVVVNGGDPDAATFQAVLDAADEAEVSLVFTGTWAVDRGGIRLLERHTGRVAVGTQGYGDGPVQLTGFDPDHRLFAGLDGDPATLIVEGGYYSVIESYDGVFGGRELADLLVERGDDEPVTGTAAAWDWRTAGSVEILLSASAVTGAVGPGKGWTADGGRLLINAVEWAREAQMTPPPAPTVAAEAPATVADTVEVTGTSQWPWPVTVSRDGVPVATVHPADDGTWTAKVPLEVGDNEITAVAVNPAGESAPSDPVTVARWQPEWRVVGAGPARVVRLTLNGAPPLAEPADTAELVLRDADGAEVRREPLRWVAVFYLGILTRLPAGDYTLSAELEVDGHLLVIDGPELG